MGCSRQFVNIHLPLEAIVHSAIGTGCRERDDRAAVLLPILPDRFYIFPVLICVVLTSPEVIKSQQLEVFLVSSFVRIFLRVDTRYQVRLI